MGLGRKDILTLVVCTLECILHGAIFNGWPAMVYIYKDQGLFECDRNETLEERNSTTSSPCPQQDRNLSLAYTICVTFFGLFSLPAGSLFDRYGLRLLRTITILIGIIGASSLGFASKDYPFFIFIGMICIGWSCSTICVTSMHVASLAGRRTPSMVVLLQSCINSSGLVFWLVKVAYDYGIHYRWPFVVLASTWLMVLFSTYVLLPKHKILNQDSDIDRQGDTPNSVKRGGLGHILTVKYTSNLLYFNILYVYTRYVVGTLNIWLMVLFQSQELVSFYTNMFTYVQVTSGLVFGPVIGLMTGFFQKCLYTGKFTVSTDATMVSKNLATVPGLVLGSISYFIVAICVLYLNPWSLYLVMGFNEIGKAFLFGTTTAYVSLSFPSGNFGFLYGLMFASSSVTLPLQYGYLRWTEVSGHTVVSLFLIATIAASIAHPISVSIHATRKKRSPTEKNIYINTISKP